MPEMWGSCQPCNRLFFVPFTTGEEMARTRCPVCSATPSAFEVRIGDRSFGVSVSDNSTTGDSAAVSTS